MRSLNCQYRPTGFSRCLDRPCADFSEVDLTVNRVKLGWLGFFVSAITGSRGDSHTICYSNLGVRNQGRSSESRLMIWGQIPGKIGSDCS